MGRWSTGPRSSPERLSSAEPNRGSSFVPLELREPRLPIRRTLCEPAESWWWY